MLPVPPEPSPAATAPPSWQQPCQQEPSANTHWHQRSSRAGGWRGHVTPARPPRCPGLCKVSPRAEGSSTQVPRVAVPCSLPAHRPVPVGAGQGSSTPGRWDGLQPAQGEPRTRRCETPVLGQRWPSPLPGSPQTPPCPDLKSIAPHFSHRCC